MKLWHVARWVLLVLWVLAVALVMVRGPEDAWIRDASGQWVAHGHPAGPPPAAGYVPPLYERVLPFVFLGLIGAALLFAAFFAGRSPAGRDSLDRSIRYYGALSVVSTVLAVCLAVLLLVGLLTELDALQAEPAFIALCLGGVIVLMKVLGWHADTTKRVLEAHYDLKRATALLQDTVERLASEGRKDGAALS